MKQYKRSLYIFRRDFRLIDNTALIQAVQKSTEIIACFIMDPRQVDASNTFRSLNAIQFMIESLIDLEQQIAVHYGKLHIFIGKQENVIEQLFKELNIDGLFANHDYTPFSLQRDAAIENIARQYHVNMELFHDFMLHEPDEIKKNNHSFYSIFTPYWKAGVKLQNIKLPRKIGPLCFFNKPLSPLTLNDIYKKLIPRQNNNLHIPGGRKNSLKIINNLAHFKSYEQDRNIPAKQTTNLSAHLKFGTISIREVYNSFLHQLGSDSPLLRQLYWHDFYMQIAYHNPCIYSGAFHEKYNKIVWSNNKGDFDRWCKGITGFPIVDAGMRQLHSTGFMHNRVRMIVASFLIKDLHIDWQWGEKYFAQHLIDYDPAINNGNWQWIASTGCDPQPYFRIFNPWLQQKKFDPECVYIKKWIPELKDIASKVIHTWPKYYSLITTSYPKPMIDHAKEVAKTKKLYKQVLK